MSPILFNDQFPTNAASPIQARYSNMRQHIKGAQLSRQHIKGAQFSKMLNAFRALKLMSAPKNTTITTTCCFSSKII